MKKFLGTRLGIILVTMLVCTVIFGGVAFAATTYTKDLPASGVILKANPGLTLYSDVACTIEITAIPFPNVNAGDTASLPTMYLKNTGNKDLTGVAWTSNLNPAWGSISGNVNQGTLLRNESKSITLSIVTLVNGVSADTPYNATVSFTGTY